MSPFFNSRSCRTHFRVFVMCFRLVQRCRVTEAASEGTEAASHSLVCSFRHPIRWQTACRDRRSRHGLRHMRAQLAWERCRARRLSPAGATQNGSRPGGQWECRLRYIPQCRPLRAGLPHSTAGWKLSFPMGVRCRCDGYSSSSTHRLIILVVLSWWCSCSLFD